MEARKLVDFPGGLELHIGVSKSNTCGSRWRVGLWTVTSIHALSDWWP